MIEILVYGIFRCINCYLSFIIMKLLLSFLLVVNLVELSFAPFGFKLGQLGCATCKIGERVPDNIKDALASLNTLTAKHKTNVENIEKMKRKIMKTKSEISFNKMDKLLKLESKVMHKHYKTLNELEETQNKLSKTLQETQGVIKYKNSGKFAYTENSQVTNDILKPMQTYLPFENIISLKLSIPLEAKLSPVQKEMIDNYDKAMENIISQNMQLETLNYICNDFVLDNPDLNQLKNEILSPVIISLSESEKKIIVAQKTLLGKIKQSFIHTKASNSIEQKLRTEQAKLEGELSVITNSLQRLKSSESVTADSSMELFERPIENENTDAIDTLLTDFWNQQTSLHNEFRVANRLDISKTYLQAKMNKLTESKKKLKENIHTMISTLLQEIDTRGIPNYANKKYNPLRSTIKSYVNLYRQATHIENVYKGALEYLYKPNLPDIDIPYVELSEAPKLFNSKEHAVLNRLGLSKLVSVHFGGEIYPGEKAIHKDLNDTNAQCICVSKLCLLATFAVILAILITIIKAKI